MVRASLSKWSLVFCICIAFETAASWAAEQSTGPRKIQDNSFLVEEAYNQERGVIQHIQTFQIMRDGSWLYTFTQEWPVPGQTHQLSYTVPALHVLEPSRTTSIGDVALNYRYQLLFSGPLAVASRLSVLFPSGDYRKGTGSDAVGWQTNWPLSLEIGNHWVTHWNAGATFVPGAREPEGARADTWSFNYGASTIWLWSEHLNFMLEAVGASNQCVEDHGLVRREQQFFLNPGLRAAFNFKSGLQIVPGFSVPIGVGLSAGTHGFLTYLSFEHPLF